MLRLTEHLHNYYFRLDDWTSYGLWGFWVLMVFFFGCCWGSFLNVCIWRMPRGESVVDAPSHCIACGTHIRWYDNIPIVSFLALRGRCRSCRSRISPRYLLVELLLGILFLAAFAKVIVAGQPPAVLASYFPMLMLLVATAFIDCRHRIIPDQLTYPAMLLGVGFAFGLPSGWGVSNHWQAGLYSLAALAATGLFLGLFALLGRRLAGRDVLGWGDVKYMMGAAALLGLPAAFFILLIGSVLGSCCGVVMAVKRRRRIRGFAFAFGPFLALASLLWIFCGEKLLRLYLAVLLAE